MNDKDKLEEDDNIILAYPNKRERLDYYNRILKRAKADLKAINLQLKKEGKDKNTILIDQRNRFTTIGVINKKVKIIKSDDDMKKVDEELENDLNNLEKRIICNDTSQEYLYLLDEIKDLKCKIRNLSKN